MSDGERGRHGLDEGSPAGSKGERDDDLSVRRSEEEARAEVRERPAGAMNVRKSVRTEREEVRVPKRREEVGVERVPMDEEAPGAEISGDEEEIVVRVYEEEVVVTKRVVLKEEVRIRKRVVEEEEVVDVDLRKEEVEIDDQTERGSERGERDTGSVEPSGRHVS